MWLSGRWRLGEGLVGRRQGSDGAYTGVDGAGREQRDGGGTRVLRSIFDEAPFDLFLLPRRATARQCTWSPLQRSARRIDARTRRKSLHLPLLLLRRSALRGRPGESHDQDMSSIK